MNTNNNTTMRKQWTADDYRAIKGVKRNDVEAIKEIAKKMGRTYASVYAKVWKYGAKGRLPKFKRTGNDHIQSKVRMTRHFVIVKDYKSISLVRGAVRIKI